MKYYSTNKTAPIASLEKAVVKGLAEDKGLYMPERIKPLPQEFFDNIDKLSFQEIAYHVADCFFGEDVDSESLRAIVYDTLQFDCPVVKVTDNIYTLELFHGPTLAFKDVGARFMARLLQYFLKRNGSYVSGSTDKSNNNVNVLVATSGDTGSAVANGFLGAFTCMYSIRKAKSLLYRNASSRHLDRTSPPWRSTECLTTASGLSSQHSWTKS